MIKNSKTGKYIELQELWEGRKCRVTSKNEWFHGHRAQYTIHRAEDSVTLKRADGVDDWWIYKNGKWDDPDDLFTEFYFVDNNNLSTFNLSHMNLLQKFALQFTGEPKKTFLKLGIISNDDVLTPDGKDLFLNFLFKASEKKFFDEVAKQLLEEEEAASKK